MAKYEEWTAHLGASKYGAPKVLVRLVDLTFGRLSLYDERVSPYADVRIASRHGEGYADVIMHCVTHSQYADGVTWNSCQHEAKAPNQWCSGCKQLHEDHALIEAELILADQKKQDAADARFPVRKRWNETEADYAIRLDHARKVTRRSFPQDLEVAIGYLASKPSASGTDVLSAMLQARYSEIDRDMVEAVIARRIRLRRRANSSERSST